MATKTNSFPITFDFNQKQRPTNVVINDDFINRKLDDFAVYNLDDMMVKVARAVGSEKLEKAIKEAGERLKGDFNFNKLLKVSLGDLILYEDVQRPIDPNHVVKIIKNFFGPYAQPLNVTEITYSDGTKKYSENNGQHTSTAIAFIVRSGYITGYDDNNWQDFKIQVLVCKNNATNAKEQRAESMVAHTQFNRATKPIQKFHDLKTDFLSYKFYNKKSPKNLEAHNICKIMSKYGCYPIDLHSCDVGKPGTATHMPSIYALAKNGKKDNYELLDFAFKTRQKFWDNLPVHSEELYLYQDIYNICKINQISLKSAEFNNFLVDIHAIIQDIFGDTKELRKNALEAYPKFNLHNFSEIKSDITYDTYLTILYQIYKCLGGNFVIPNLDQRYVHGGNKLIQYLGKIKIQIINNKINNKQNKIQTIEINLPKKEKKSKKKK